MPRWLLPLAVTGISTLECLQLNRLQLVLADSALVYRTLTRGTVVLPFSDIRQIKDESGWDNVGEVGPIPVSRFVIQSKNGDEIRVNLGAFRDDSVYLFCGNLQRKCQEHGVHYLNTFL